MNFAEKLFAHLFDTAKAMGVERLSKEVWLRQVQLFADKERPMARVNHRNARGRDELFDALALATGTRDLARLTRQGARTIAVALAEIREATPEVTPDELRRAAEVYARRHPTWALTATALAKHWGEFGHVRTSMQRRDVYQEPPNWRERARARFPGLETLPDNWADLSITVRAELLKEQESNG